VEGPEFKSQYRHCHQKKKKKKEEEEEEEESLVVKSQTMSV
jgi:hypothetical protein